MNRELMEQALSDKLTAIQSELSQLSKMLSEHFAICHVFNTKGQDTEDRDTQVNKSQGCDIQGHVAQRHHKHNDSQCNNTAGRDAQLHDPQGNGAEGRIKQGHNTQRKCNDAEGSDKQRHGTQRHDLRSTDAEGRDKQGNDTQCHISSSQIYSANEWTSCTEETDVLAHCQCFVTEQRNQESEHTTLQRRGGQEKVKIHECEARMENTADSTVRTQCESMTVQGETFKKKNKRSFKESKQDVLRKAIQTNIVLLVDNLPYSQNDILDMLIEKECLTETECSDLRDNGSRKDRVRNLVRIIKWRPFTVLKNFVNCVKEIHPEIAEAIWQVYEKLAKDKKNYVRQCAFCLLKKSVDIKVFADHTWSTHAISDKLYAEIVVGMVDIDVLWRQLADAYNTTPSTVRQNTLKTFSESLMKKGHYRDLVLKLNKVSNLKCTCVKLDTDDDSSLTCNNILPSIVKTDVDETSTVSPRSTPASARSLTDVNETSLSSESGFPVNEHENYIMSSRAFENEKNLYNVRFGTRKAISDVEFRKPRRNSIGRDTIENCYGIASRRRSSYL